jgi:hypothetical protein
MKRFKKVLLVLLTVSLVNGTFYSVGSPQEFKGIGLRPLRRNSVWPTFSSRDLWE